MLVRKFLLEILRDIGAFSGRYARAFLPQEIESKSTSCRNIHERQIRRLKSSRSDPRNKPFLPETGPKEHLCEEFRCAPEDLWILGCSNLGWRGHSHLLNRKDFEGAVDVLATRPPDETKSLENFHCIRQPQLQHWSSGALQTWPPRVKACLGRDPCHRII